MKASPLRPIAIRSGEVVFDEDTPGRGDERETLVVVTWRGGVLGTQAPTPRLEPEIEANLLRQILVDALLTPCSGDGYSFDHLFAEKRGLGAQPPTLTVAVCTAGKRRDLDSALRSVVHDGAPSEILVVDNSGEAGSAVASAVRRRFPCARVVRAPVAGLDRARNVALAEATSDVVAFLDDDAIADENWPTAVRAAFAEEPQLGVLTGLVLPLELETQAQLRFERYAGFGKGFDRRWWEEVVAASRNTDPSLRFRTWEIGTGTNMAVRRNVLLGLGGFDPALCLGTPALGGGDLEMFFRVAKSGWSIRYEPGAFVWHRHRRDMSSLRSQVRGFGGVAAMVLAILRADPHELGSMPALLSWYRSCFGWRIRPSPRTDRELLVHELLGYLTVATAGMWLALLRAVKVGDLSRYRWQPPDGPPRSAGLAEFTIDLAQPQPLHYEVQGCAATRWSVCANHRQIGTVAMHSDGSAVSFARVREAIAREFGLRLVSTNDRDAVRKRLSRARLHSRA